MHPRRFPVYTVAASMNFVAEQYVQITAPLLRELQVAATYRRRGMTRVAQVLGPIGVGDHQLARVALGAQVPVHAVAHDRRLGLHVGIQPRPLTSTTAGGQERVHTCRVSGTGRRPGATSSHAPPPQ